MYPVIGKFLKFSEKHDGVALVAVLTGLAGCAEWSAKANVLSGKSSILCFFAIPALGCSEMAALAPTNALSETNFGRVSSINLSRNERMSNIPAIKRVAENANDSYS